MIFRRADAARAFGQALKEARLMRGLSQERLAELGEFDRTYPSLLERGRRTPTFFVYFKLSRAPSKGRLNLYVQSAYVQDEIPRTRPKPRKPIRFSVIAYNVAVGKAIKVPK